MKYAYILLLVTLISCKPSEDHENLLNQMAERYVKLGLDIGQYDSDFVDAYYGPDHLRPNIPKREIFPKDSFLLEIRNLTADIQRLEVKDSVNKNRAFWLLDQLQAFEKRVEIFSGKDVSFDEESLALFGAKAPQYDWHHYQKLIDDLNVILPGNGSIPSRYQELMKKFIIPVDKLDTVFEAAVNECRRITQQFVHLPLEESFEIEYVTNKAWSGYNWYQGHYKSKIQINTDFPIPIERAIDVGSHESYPGHHVYNMLLEKNLYREKGWVEMSLYPLFSPQSFIAEGSANYGIDMAFPEKEKIHFAKEILLPLAGLDTAGISTYFKAVETVAQLNYCNNDIARKYFDKTITREEAIGFLQEYGLYTPEKAQQRMDFIEKYRSYVINYNYGKDLVKNYVLTRSQNNHKESQWVAFQHLLSNQIRIKRLLE